MCPLLIMHRKRAEIGPRQAVPIEHLQPKSAWPVWMCSQSVWPAQQPLPALWCLEVLLMLPKILFAQPTIQPAGDVVFWGLWKGIQAGIPGHPLSRSCQGSGYHSKGKIWLFAVRSKIKLSSQGIICISLWKQCSCLRQAEHQKGSGSDVPFPMSGYQL